MFEAGELFEGNIITVIKLEFAVHVRIPDLTKFFERFNVQEICKHKYTTVIWSLGVRISSCTFVIVIRTHLNINIGDYDLNGFILCLFQDMSGFKKKMR